MAQTSRLRAAQTLALALPAGLLGGAYVSQYGFDMFPCEMCWWQRWPHFAALGFALIGFVMAPKRLWAALAGIAVIISGLIGGFHAGVEYGWWEGITGCAIIPTGADAVTSVMDTSTPLVRCDVAPWSLFGVSLAGWNFLFSCLGGITILGLIAKQERA